MFGKKGIRLQFVINFFIILIIIFTILINWYTSMNVQKNSLIERYLESNYNYVQKLALSTKDTLNYMQSNLIAIGHIVGNRGFGQIDLDTWYEANNHHFNSIFITDNNGVILQISPSVVQFNEGRKVMPGTKIQSETMKTALEIKQPFISEPYRATSGQLIMLISAPIFDRSGSYQGLIGGTIYLESENVIKRILNTHEYVDGSYVYVTDKKGHLIYHPDSTRIGADVSENEVVQEVLQGKYGTDTVVNTLGKEFLAGYTFEENTGWGIISQTPTSIINLPLRELFKNIVIQSLPFLLVILIVTHFLVSRISRPVNALAKFSEESSNNDRLSCQLKVVSTKSSIYEIRQLYHQFNNYLRMLDNKINIDGLTGVANRKYFDTVIKEWVEHKIPFSLVMVDIDRFKKVNDTYGHLVGDEVLKYLTKIIASNTRKRDLCFRYGGEEFGILLKHTNIVEAYEIAERLRIEVAEKISPSGESITISLGISSLLMEDVHPKTIIERADQALYQSKENGRNQTTIHNKEYNREKRAEKKVQ